MLRSRRIAELLYKSLTGGLTEEERDELTQWEAESGQNRLLRQRLNDREELVRLIKGYYECWNEEKLVEQPGPVIVTDGESIKLSGNGAFKKYWLPAAAVLVLVAGVIAFFKSGSNSDSIGAGIPAGYDSLVTGPGGYKAITLSDSSKVWLNAASALYFPKVFDKGIRKVYLKGEAYFEIARDNEKSFVVNTRKEHAHNDIEIKVLGTRFNVMAYKDSPVIKTSVLSGRVQVRTKQEAIKAHANEQAVVDHNGHPEKVKVDTSQVMAWLNEIYEANDAPLSDIMNKLAVWYDIEVEYKGDRHAKFSIPLHKRWGLNYSLDILRETGRVDFIVEGRKVIVKGNK